MCRLRPFYGRLHRVPVIVEVSFNKKAHFPKVIARTGLTILDCRKEEVTESHKIDELYEFSNDSSRD